MKRDNITFGINELYLLSIYESIIEVKINKDIMELINKNNSEIINNEILKYKIKKNLEYFKDINYSELFDNIRDIALRNDDDKFNFYLNPEVISLLLKIGKIWSDCLNLNKNRIKEDIELKNIKINTLTYIYTPLLKIENKERYFLEYLKNENGDFLDGKIRRLSILCDEGSFREFDPNDWKDDENPAYELKKAATLKLNKNHIDDVILISKNSTIDGNKLYEMNKGNFNKKSIKNLDYDIKIKKTNGFLEVKKKKRTISDYISEYFLPGENIILDYEESDFGYFKVLTKGESLRIISEDDGLFVFIPKTI